jgi:hypothetical protein
VRTDIYILQDDIADYRTNRGRLLTIAEGVHRSSFLHFVAYKNRLSSVLVKKILRQKTMRRSIKTGCKEVRSKVQYRAAESNGFAADLKCGVLRRRECVGDRRTVTGVF